jgi:uncharacterized protein YcfL
MLRYLLSAMCIFSLIGCGSYKAITQSESGSFLQLKGNYQNSNLSIDNHPSIQIDKNQKTFTLNGEQVIKFTVSAGTHTIKISRDGSEVVNRKIYVSEGNVFEVMVP